MIRNLKLKACLILMIAGALFAGLEVAVQHWVIQPHFVTLELDEAKKDMQRCVSAIEREAEHLDTLCVDWAAWDDTYDFVVDHNAKYVQANMTPETFKANRLDFLYLVDKLGQTVHSLVIEEGEKGTHPIEHVLGPFRQQLLAHNELESCVRGLVLTPLGPALVASRPVLTSEHKGPARGVLIMGRLLSEGLVMQLRQQTAVPMRLATLADGEPPAELSSPEVGDCGDGVKCRYRDSQILEMYAVINGVNNRPALMSSAPIARKISQRGDAANRMALISFILACVTMVAVVLAMLEWIVFRPMCRLATRLVQTQNQSEPDFQFDPPAAPPGPENAAPPAPPAFRPAPDDWADDGWSNSKKAPARK